MKINFFGLTWVVNFRMVLLLGIMNLNFIFACFACLACPARLARPACLPRDLLAVFLLPALFTMKVITGSGIYIFKNVN
jgi:hypothetical protein